MLLGADAEEETLCTSVLEARFVGTASDLVGPFHFVLSNCSLSSRGIVESEPISNTT